MPLNTFKIVEILLGIEINMHSYCVFFTWMGTFNVVYGSLGSFGIAVYRDQCF
jgi:hypothetical protein